MTNIQEWREKLIEDCWSPEFIDDFVRLGLQPKLSLSGSPTHIQIKFKTKDDMNLYKLTGNNRAISNCVLLFDD